MPFKARTVPGKLIILRILNKRMDQTVDEKKYYLYQEKGFEGEVQFDLLTEKIQSECYILNDLLLNVNNTTFQLDTTIIFQKKISFFEVKNYEGDYCFRNGRFETLAEKEIKNPLDQLRRSKSLLRQLLQKHGYNLPIEGYVVYINPRFTLYQAPVNEPIIYPTQLDALMENLNAQPSKLTTKHKKIAEKLVSLHQMDASFIQVPAYNFDQVKKGITCKECSSFSMFVQGKKIVCGDCRCEEVVESAVLRMVDEIKLLFPDRKITTNLVHEWCVLVESKKRISRILERIFKRVGVRNWTFYE
ncbi:NERD domain-containing protein [Bacillus sp. ISL-75]|uniref:nuclease-related domain-containing protein n=1 Tax=Bacillus sp. ISL-75 TaxID=2819137 RepID=UPI001BEB2A4D|nr:nuclease-related domain-containing protein [Bacillus sp. ISL-75]MBT2729940.1 NERD domain-containing protein [Bacillus sp. ISL-75]